MGASDVADGGEGALHQPCVRMAREVRRLVTRQAFGTPIHTATQRVGQGVEDALVARHSPDGGGCRLAQQRDVTMGALVSRHRL